MRISLVLAPLLLLLAPLILVVMASFTTFAVVTSLLALTVVSVRLGFFAVEFSGGVLLYVIRWSLRKSAKPEEKFTVNHDKGLNNINSSLHKREPNQKQHNQSSKKYSQHVSYPQKQQQQRKNSQLYRAAATKVNMWDANNFSGNFDLDQNIRDELAMGEDYFMLTDGINTKRPFSRRSRSYV
ncbi:hypothetical protein G9A89_023230 [Geosiphon pyriformis]|nr:hypothetical protein G9A89_023230 [Geosiphon pyriformis]